MMIKDGVCKAGHTDWHSHILAGIDDGSASTADSIEYLTRAAEVGIDTVIATPHFYPYRHRVDEFTERRERAYNKLIGRAPPVIPKIIKGAEVLLCTDIDRMERLSSLCIENTDILMLELPFVVAEHTDELFETVYRLISEMKYEVIMVHPHRYPPESVMRMVDLGARLQLNAADVTAFGTNWYTKRLLATGRVVALGSDAHRDKKAYDSLAKAINKLSGKYEPEDINKKITVRR